MARQRNNPPPTFAHLLDRLRTLPQTDLRPALQGLSYRFTLFLPLIEKSGREVFSGEQIYLLSKLFHDRFEGFSANTADSSPPWYGSWLAPGEQEPDIDRHMQFVIYTPQTDAAKEFFGYLKSILQRPEIAGQQIVLIEHSLVWLVPAIDLPMS